MSVATVRLVQFALLRADGTAPDQSTLDESTIGEVEFFAPDANDEVHLAALSLRAAKGWTLGKDRGSLEEITADLDAAVSQETGGSLKAELLAEGHCCTPDGHCVPCAGHVFKLVRSLDGSTVAAQGRIGLDIRYVLSVSLENPT